MHEQRRKPEPKKLNMRSKNTNLLESTHNLISIPIGLFMELDKLNVKFLWMNSPDKSEGGREIRAFFPYQITRLITAAIKAFAQDIQINS